MATNYSNETQTGTLDTPEDAGKGAVGQYRLWTQALDLQDKEERKWRESAGRTIDIYRDALGALGDTDSAEIGGKRNRRYNILYSNTETMAPALYNSTPIPDIRRRFSDPDPIARQASQVLERAISFSVDNYDFDTVMRQAVKDLLLPGRGVTRVRYKPVIEQRFERISVVKNEAGYVRASDLGAVEDESQIQEDEAGFFLNGEPYEHKAYEEVCCEHVQWGDFRRGPGKTWDEVQWIAFRHFLTRGEVEKLNPQIGQTIALDTTLNSENQQNRGNQKPEPDIFKRLLVWEIWDKSSEKVYFIAPSYQAGPLKVEDDPLELEGFFPIPRPLYAVQLPESLVPVELYRLYRDQADELNIITLRLTRLTRAAKLQGIYAAPNGDNSFERMQNVDDGGYVPAQEVFSVASDKGLSSYVWEKPIDKCVQAINVLSARQQAVIENIYQITGISDILRGQTKSSETATAQNIKAQWGSLRLQQMQAEVARYARDLFRLMSEIIADKFSPDTLQNMTGLQVPPEVEQLLRNDAMRAFRIDIETDSTIQADVQKTQQNMTQFIQGLGQFIQAISPAVQSNVVPMDFVTTFVQAGARTFRLPRQVLDSIEAMGQQPPQQNPNAGAQQAEAQKSQLETQRTQMDMQKTQVDAQIAQQKGQLDVLKMQMEAEREQQAHQFAMMEMQEKHRITMAELAAKTGTTIMETVQ